MATNMRSWCPPGSHGTTFQNEYLADDEFATSETAVIKLQSVFSGVP